MLDARPQPIPKQRQEARKKDAPRLAPAELVDRAFHRISATRSVAADKLGEANKLTIDLGFHAPVEETASAVSAELARQKLVLHQKDEHGVELPAAKINLAAFKTIGLSDGYIKRKIDPLLKELAPFQTALPTTTTFESLLLWIRTTVVAAKDSLTVADRVFDDPDRVLKYRNAQPVSQAGRFTKRAIARRAAGRARKAAQKAKRAAALAAKKAARKAKRSGIVPGGGSSGGASGTVPSSGGGTGGSAPGSGSSGTAPGSAPGTVPGTASGSGGTQTGS